MCEKRLVYVCNAGWYFRLHWLARARYFIGEGWSVHLICPMESAEQKQDLSKDGLFVHDFRIDRKSIGLVGALKEFMQLYSMIKKLSPDLINAITIKPNVYVGIISVLEGIPAALSVTGLGIIFSSNTIKSKIARVFTLPLYWLIAKFSQRLFFIFENSNDRAVLIERANIPAGKCAVVSGAGVDPSLYRAVPITKVDSTLKLLYASRLLKSKGLLDLIAAVNRLQEKGYSVELTIAGIVDTNSDDAISLSEIDAMTSPSHIRYLGERDDVPKLVAETHIVCLPTYYGEGIPRILIEGAAVGRPLITTDCGGCAEICLNELNGFIVEAKSPADLEDKIVRYMRNPDLIFEHGDFSGRLFLSKFTNEIVFNQFSTIYNELLD